MRVACRNPQQDQQFQATLRFLCDIGTVLSLDRISREGAGMKRRSVWAAVALTATAAVSGGCAVDVFEAQESEREGEATQAVIVTRPCGAEQCGENSPVIDVFKFHDANLRGVQNTIGMSIDTVRGIAQIV